MFVELSKIAVASLGYKSLQNNFFYVNRPTIESYGIEERFLTAILKLAGMSGRSYEQDNALPTLWLFNCKEKKTDLRGTGALRYIEAMADRSAAEKKQSGKNQTIREALEAQGGGLWYAPKARPNRHHIWLRKAIDGVFAPFLFHDAMLVDQRCNSVCPLPGIEWKEIAAVLTTSLFAYSLEINGAASMGAGALEAPTTKLRAYPVFDVSQLKPSDRRKLVSLAERVWSSETPVDWSEPGKRPGARLRELDKWILDAAGREVSTDRVYDDLHEVCQSRITVAKDKGKKTKKKQTDSIGNVAESIAKGVRPKIEIRNFPDDFVSGAKLDLSFNFDRRSLKQVNISPLLDSFDIEVLTITGDKAYEGTHPQPVAEAIIRSLLWGRSIFSVSSDRSVMHQAVSAFLGWGAKIEKDISTAISDSALGTGYEDALRREVYARLGVHPLSVANLLPSQIAF